MKILSFSDVDDVHDLMDDIQEQNELAEEISQALTQGVGAQADIDDVRLLMHCYTDSLSHVIITL